MIQKKPFRCETGGASVAGTFDGGTRRIAIEQSVFAVAVGVDELEIGCAHFALAWVVIVGRRAVLGSAGTGASVTSVGLETVGVG